MRAVTALSCLLVLGVLSGCAPGSNGELRAIVEEAAPAGSSLDCEWGSSGFENEPKSWYGCWDYTSGKLHRVAGSFKSRLAAQGYFVSFHGDALGVELTGVRGAHTLCIDVLTSAFVHGRNTAPSEVDLAPGQLFIDVWTVEPRAAGVAPCAPLPDFPE